MSLAYLKSVKMMYKSDKTLKLWYRQLNKKWHNNELPDDTIVCWYATPRSVVALTEKLEDGRFRILFHPSMYEFHKYIKLTLHHEMLHVKHWRPGLVDHGRVFQQSMLELASRGAFNSLW